MLEHNGLDSNKGDQIVLFTNENWTIVTVFFFEI